MAYYLDTYIGKGVRGDDWRPSIVDSDPKAHLLDMRPTGTGAGGIAIVRSDIQVPKSLIKISDDKLTKSRALVNAIQNRFGLNLPDPNMNFADALTDLFVNHSSNDHTRWNPLSPALVQGPLGQFPGAQRYEIWLGDLVASWAVIQGGGIFTDNFNRTNSTTIGNNWQETVGDFDISSNQLHLVTNSGAVGNYLRWNNDVGSPDMYTQVKVASSVNYSEYYILARYAAAAQTFYFYAVFNDGSVPQPRNIRKSIAGGESRISATDSTNTHVDGDIEKIVCSGSTLTSYRNGVVVNTVTDTSITSGNLGGLGGFINGTTLLFDDAEVGDLKQGRPGYKAAGSIALKPWAYKSGGVVTNKPVFVMVGGVLVKLG